MPRMARSQASRGVVGRGLSAPPGRRVAPAPVDTVSASRVQKDPAYLSKRLARELAEAIGARRVELIRDTRGLVVSMPDDAAFPVGSASANGETRRLIERVGDTLRTVPNAIRIEGHTDDVPIKTTRYESNWELSTARASAVVALLIGVGIDADRLSAAGYGQYHPLNPNDTPAHRGESPCRSGDTRRAGGCSGRAACWSRAWRHPCCALTARSRRRSSAVRSLAFSVTMTVARCAASGCSSPARAGRSAPSSVASSPRAASPASR